tara:strand:- start:380 stop:556 length:177 start_codon:yes stop_codon:yes gene_type:complete
MPNLKKYKFTDTKNNITVSFQSLNDQTAIVMLSSIVKSVIEFDKMKSYKINKNKKKKQ